MRPTCTLVDLQTCSAPADVRTHVPLPFLPVRAVFGRTRVPVQPLPPGVIETSGPELPCGASGLGGGELRTLSTRCGSPQRSP